jgi:predicted enzyme related to lactoylglutathione lyase
MYLGEICLLTQNVPRLAGFYRTLLQAEGGNADEEWQAVVQGEPMLTVMRSEALPAHAPQRAVLAFTVEDMEAAFAHVRSMGPKVLQPPMRQPWGTVNMILEDPDGNRVYLRQFAGAKEEEPS